eukprot:m.53650 g.53650  ORF g.53650 m.53650 type:complete len:66 (+) comp12814_c2_seq2:607-804(+)
MKKETRKDTEKGMLCVSAVLSRAHRLSTSASFLNVVLFLKHVAPYRQWDKKVNIFDLIVSTSDGR